MSDNVDTATPTVHLQSIGRVPAVEAQQLQPGDMVMWNGGSTSKVLKVEEASKHFVRVHLASTVRGKYEAEADVRRWKKSTLIGVQSAAVRTPATPPVEPTPDACAAAAPTASPAVDPAAPAPTEGFWETLRASGLQLGDLVEYDGRIVDDSGTPRFVPGGRGRLCDVYVSGGEVVARIQLAHGDSDVPALQNLRPATTTVAKKASELQAGDIVRVYGMRVRLDELSCPPYSSGGGLVYSWLGTVLNLAEVHHEVRVPRSFLCEWSGRTLVREDAWTVQGNDLVRHAVEVPEGAAPESAAPSTITVTTATTRMSLSNRLRAANAPGEMVTSDELGGVLRWRLPNGKELTRARPPQCS
ncbi:hypothetical protein AB0O57_29615 [Streptomyces sp. NPDC091201]|uniref:hypothetical protein n=1 Tax=Streptomyces sp. NPDC091201 TaxID=3155190 RepID=UPI0034422AEA